MRPFLLFAPYLVIPLSVDLARFQDLSHQAGEAVVRFHLRVFPLLSVYHHQDRRLSSPAAAGTPVWHGANGVGIRELGVVHARGNGHPGRFEPFAVAQPREV